jgi:hypothetical protein
LLRFPLTELLVSFSVHEALSVRKPPLLAAFKRNPKETRVIGYLLTTYSDIELELCKCLAEALHGNNMLAVTIMFRLRGEENRLQILDAILRPQLELLKLLPEYEKIYSAVQRVKKIRNQYAHCHWDHTTKKGNLRFTNLEAIAKARSDKKFKWHTINLALLEFQRSFFHLTFVAIQLLRMELKAKREDTPSTQLAEALQELTEPPLCNDPA